MYYIDQRPCVGLKAKQRPSNMAVANLLKVGDN